MSLLNRARNALLWQPLAWALGAVALLVLARQSLLAASAMKIPIQFFAAGMSLSKVYLFWAYVALLGVLLSVLRPKTSRRWWWAAIGFYALAAICSLVSHFIAFSRLGLSPLETAVVVQGGGISESKLLHIHSLKPVLYGLGRAFGQDLQGSYDAGAPFGALVPGWLLVVAGLSVLGAMVSSIRCLLAALPNWSTTWRVGFLGLATVASFAAFKGTLDGGPLGHEFLLGVPLLLLVLRLGESPGWRPSGRFWLDLGIVALLLLGGAVAMTTWFYRVQGLALLKHLVPYMGLSILLAGIVALPVLWASRRWIPFGLAAVVSVTAMAYLMPYHPPYHELKYLRQHAKKGVTVAVAVPDRGPAKKWCSGTSYDGPHDDVCRFKLRQSVRIGDLVAKYRLRAAFYPVEGLNCFDPLWVEGTVVPLRKQHLRIRSQDSLVHMHYFGPSKRHPRGYDFVAEVKACTPTPRKLVLSYLSAYGLGTFAALDLKQSRRRRLVHPSPPSPIERRQVVVIILEAARFSYLESYAREMPFLRHLGRRGCQSDLTPAAPTFSAANSLAIMTGAHADRHGLLHILDYTRDGKFRLVYEDTYTPYYSKLPNVHSMQGWTEGKDRDVTHLRDIAALQKYVHSIRIPISTFWLLDTESEHLSQLDNNAKLRRSIRNLDRGLAHFYNQVKSYAPNTMFVILGDHGMAEIDQVIQWPQLEARLRKIGFPVDESEPWIDAGVGLRFWWPTAPSPARIKTYEALLDGEFENDPCLEVFGAEKRRKVHLDLDRYRTGDIMIAVKPGCLVGAQKLPRPYLNVPKVVRDNERWLLRRRAGVNSMHGYYHVHHPKLRPLLIIDDPRLNGCDRLPLQVIDIAPTILEYLGKATPLPKSIQGRSIYQQLAAPRASP